MEEAEPRVVATWRRACLEHGFLYLVNHGVPDAVISEFMAQQRAFFRLPVETKMQILQDKNNRGYTPYQESTLDPENSKRPDTHEGLYFGRDIAADSEEGALPLHGPNQWLPEEVLPGYHAATQKYYDAVTTLMRRTLSILALSLDLPRTHFDSLFARPIASLRPLHYSAIKARPEEGSYSAGAHTDYGCLTFLLTDGTPGLQICVDGVWGDVPHLPGALVVNLGDMLERWTGGQYRSTLHRVVCSGDKERFSAAFFVEPNFETVVDVFPQCLKEGGISYEPIQCGKYLLDKYAATHSGYKLAPASVSMVAQA